MSMFESMSKTSIAELKTSAPRVIREVEGGTPCFVTRRNRPVARIIPCGEIENQTHVGFDPQVKVHSDLTEPAFDPTEWGNLVL